MNQMSAAQALVAMLGHHDVDTVFGLCGDTSLPFYDALYRTGDGIRHVLTRGPCLRRTLSGGCCYPAPAGGPRAG